MGLFNRQKKSKDANLPAELKPYYSEDKNPLAGSWLRWILGGIILLVVIVLAALFIRWVWHEAHTTSKKPAKPPTAQSQQTKPVPKAATTTPAQNSANPNAASNSGSASTQGAPVTTTPALSNSGPGDTVAIFVGVTLAGIVIYQYHLRSRAQTD